MYFMYCLRFPAVYVLLLLGFFQAFLRMAGILPTAKPAPKKFRDPLKKTKHYWVKMYFREIATMMATYATKPGRFR